MNTVEEKGLVTLEAQLKKGNRQLTIGDAASFSALNLDDAKRALDHLLGKYHSSLKVTDQGDLIYDFGASLRARGTKSFKEIWANVRRWSWKAFKIVFKVWITVMLVVYFVVFLVILIALIVAMMSSDSDSDSDGGGGLGSFFSFMLIADLFRDLFIYNSITGKRVYRTDAYGYRYQAYEPRSMRVSAKKKKKSFVASVYDYVFGPPRVEQHPLENYKEVATFLRKNKGLLVKSEIIGLAGWKNDAAADFFADCMVRFNGDAQITDNAVLVADFKEIVRGKATTEVDHPVVWYWDEYEAPYQQTGNTTGRNLLITGMTIFNLFFALVFVTQSPEMTLITFLLGIVPLVFSIIFFTVPILRFFYNRKRNKKRHLQNIRKRIMRIIFGTRNGEITDSQLNSVANQQVKGEQLSKKQVTTVMNELIHDLGGDMSVNDEAVLTYRFERLQTELKEVEKIRSQKRGGTDSLGNVVFDSSKEI